MIDFDFVAARERNLELMLMYRRLLHTQLRDGTWDWWLESQIDETGHEIALAHRLENEKMTTARNSDHPVIIKNVIFPNIPQWDVLSKEVVR